MRERITLACILAFACLLPACTIYRPRDRFDPPAPVPAAYVRPIEGEQAGEWWKTFNDPALDALMVRAFAENLQLKSAWARLDQACALAAQAGARLYPTLDATATATRTRVSPPTAMAERTGNLFTIGVAAAYEVDVWGRLRSLRTEAELQALASRDDLETVAIALAASVGETWYALVEQRETLRLLAEQTKASETFLELTELRFSQGQASALDIYQQRTQLAATRAQVAPTQARLAILEHQLSVLLGEAPGALLPSGREALPDLPILPGAGLPADLLTRRPDVRAAHARLAAADQHVAAAVADRLPALRLTAGAGFQDNKAASVFDNWVWNIAANLTAPLFDAGRRRAEVKRNEAVVIALLHDYGQVVLTAIREVEDALVLEQYQHTLLADQDRQVTLAKATLSEARARYANGLSNYLPVLTALTTLHRLQIDRIAAQRQLISFRIQLYRALGGTWTWGLHPTVDMPFSDENGDK